MLAEPISNLEGILDDAKAYVRNYVGRVVGEVERRVVDEARRLQRQAISEARSLQREVERRAIEEANELLDEGVEWLADRVKERCTALAQGKSPPPPPEGPIHVDIDKLKQAITPCQEFAERKAHKVVLKAALAMLGISVAAGLVGGAAGSLIMRR
jgi:hypothetical protein